MFISGKPYVAASSHANYHAIVKAVNDRDWNSIPSLINTVVAIKEHLSESSTGSLIVDAKAAAVTFQGEPLHGCIVNRLLDMARDGYELAPMERFLEKLHQNPSFRAVTELYGWIEANGITITEDGDFVAFKRVRNDYKSFHDGKTDNSIGTSPSMPRNQVDDNASTTCSTGLHFCSQGYLKYFHSDDGRVVLLKINPKDVVSIPTDYDNSKGRASTYYIMGELDEDTAHHTSSDELILTQPVITSPEAVKKVEAAYRDGYAAGYKDGRGKKARLASHDGRESLEYDTGYENGRSDGRQKKPNLYPTADSPSVKTMDAARNSELQRLVEVVKQYYNDCGLSFPFNSVSVVTEDTPLDKDGEFDELDHLELIMCLEDELHVEIADDATPRTYGELLTLVNSCRTP